MTLIDLYIDGPSVADTAGSLLTSVTDERPPTTAIGPDPDELPADMVADRVADMVVDEGPLGTSYPRCADGNGTLTHLFFSDDEFDIARAKAICAKCGLADACLTGALDRAEPFGVWGGSLLVDGVIVEVKRGRGRPPKQPRPPLVVDEVPIPPHLVA
jgi:WhiB family redox-sensing transcriptional regulator